ncbi:hypothetical protein [Microbulbifer thermotolerans]|uniref:hypothetical protein n=1 Tax=Microbulbifer thermotolerans TaxID=252514 RepID=UPI00224ACC05|nr:hypothetical protein [Microbulbifer thermotolerans]MCX2834483.1 hypothetical protein [Microbulbifer thermotolerans]
MNFCRGRRKRRTGRTSIQKWPQSKAWRGLRATEKNALGPNQSRTGCGKKKKQNLTFYLEKILINQSVRFLVRPGAELKRTDFRELST